MDQWLCFFFPEKTRPVYLFLDWRLTITSYWWYWLGTWDVKERDGIHPMYKAFYDVHEKNGHVKGNDGLDIDIEKGEFHMGNQMIGLTHLVRREKQTIQIKPYKRDRGARFEMFIPGRFGAIMDPQFSESVFNKLYLRHTFNPKCFRPVVMGTPSHQLWEVLGDRLQDTSQVAESDA